MATLKTAKTDESVADFLAAQPESRRQDLYAIATMMEEITGCAPRMWGPSIVGFGSYHYRYASGREGDWFQAGFAPRKQNLTLYIMSGFSQYDALLERLGKHTLGKSCLYIKRLSDVDLDVLRQMITASVQYILETYGEER